MNRIYLDYAATTPTDPGVLEVMRPYFYERFGNASSPHALGREAQKAIEDSREILARFIGAKPEEIVFTSGATESNNHAIIGIARQLRDRGNHIIISKLEHHSVEKPAEYLQQEGFKVTYLNVDQDGTVNPNDVERAITDKTILIGVLHASNEIGTIQPIKEIGTIAKKHNIPFLVDAVQTVGHLPVNVKELGADLLSLSSHKFYGPKGIGALYIRKGLEISGYLLGGDQERGRRASTQNVAGAVGLAKAAEICQENMDHEIEQQSKLRDYIIEEIPKRIEGVQRNGHPTNRLPNNAHFSFEKVQGEELIMSLDMAGIAASMGSACTAGALEPSHVLRAIGLSDDMAYGSLRITVGRWTKQEDVDCLLDELPKIVKRLRI